MVGVYKIQSKSKTHRVYIGSSVNIKRRFQRHKRDLRNGKSASTKLQRHFDKYGESDLQFDILLECSQDKIIEMEQYFIDLYVPYFNICPKAYSSLGVRFKLNYYRPSPCGMLSKHHSQLTKDKMSEKMIDKWKEPEYKKKAGGKKCQIAWNKGIKQSSETIQKRSNSMKLFYKLNVNSHTKNMTDKGTISYV
ncbi:MAG TPA: hypothetical protein DDY71_04540 [Spirochaetia bacterium]|nr:hypothetical protein [Spirochaetia bacterium]HLD97802.1 GIY-YIG nuclease family protein [Candidatus Nanoarchaeia archaeon]